MSAFTLMIRLKLLVSEALDRVEASGLPRREHAKEHADPDRTKQARQDSPQRHLCRNRRYQQQDKVADADGDSYTEHPTKKCESHRFKQKLQNNGKSGRADCLADADLFRSLGQDRKSVV